MAFGIGLSTIFYLFWDSIVNTNFMYVAAPTIAFLALCLAGYSAIKVVKWQDSKMNESKFKVIEEITDIKVEIKIALMRVKSTINTKKEKGREIEREFLNQQLHLIDENLNTLTIKMTKAETLGLLSEEYNHDIVQLVNGYSALSALVKIMEQKNQITLNSAEEIKKIDSLLNEIINTIDQTSSIQLTTLTEIIHKAT